MIAYRQRGMTMWSAMFVIGVFVFFLFLLFKLLPPYLEDMKVRTALDGIMREAGVEAMGRAEIAERLSKRFDIDNVTNVTAEQVQIKPMGKTQQVVMEYEVVVPLFFNISALLEFNHARQVRSTE